MPKEKANRPAVLSITDGFHVDMSDVGDDEILFRRIQEGKTDFTVCADGVKLSSTAFSDRSAQPSVDRKIICEVATWTQELR